MMGAAAAVDWVGVQKQCNYLEGIVSFFIRAVGLAALFVVIMVFFAAVRYIYKAETPERS